MKKVIWGTGVFASKFAYGMKEEIDFFIDNNDRKRGQSFLGKKILCPDEVVNWDELYIYIPYTFYDEITEQLKKYGFKDETRYQKYYEINKIGAEQFEEDYKRVLGQLQQRQKQMKGSTLFWGAVWANESKGCRWFIKEWQERDKTLQLGLVSEAIWYTQGEAEDIMNLPVIVTPAVFDDMLYVDDGALEESQYIFLRDKKHVDYGTKYLKAQFPCLTDENAYYMVYYIYQYVIHVIDTLQPKLIVVNGRNKIQRTVIDEICDERKIPIISTHAGILPGTLAFDIFGEMGKSLPAIYPEEFLKLPVNEEDVEYAGDVWDYLYKSKLNRKKQQKNNCIEYVRNHIDADKPIVFFAGQNDINSHMIPYTEETIKYHSPIFKTSIDAGIYIADLCKKNGWNFVYKPHPMKTQMEAKERLPDNTIYVEFGDINDIVDISDVVVTILSSTNYVALIRHKPVVMLGYTQTKGKGCTYEAFEKDLIEGIVKEALDKGFTKEQEEAFLKHIAQVLKYYLYDDGMEREIRFGRQVPGRIEEFYELEKLLKEDAEAE